MISPEQAAEARSLAEHGRTATAVLREREWLDAAQLAALEEEEAREEFARPSTVRASAMPPEAEAVAADRSRNLDEFVLTTLLGRGGAGDVWKAWDRGLDRWVAVKISTASLESSSARERFQREAVAAARLAHPNIVPVYRIGVEHGCPFLVMPFIDGRTLHDQRPPSRNALEVMHTVALAVDHAHQQGIIHRDLKPNNIMVDRGGGVFVLDFGLAYLREESSSRLSRPGDLLGTASYMAPEQAVGDRVSSEAAVDIYGLGATLYYLVTGRPPFVGESFAAVVARVVAAQPPSPRSLDPGIDRSLETVILKALEKDPARRYVTAAAFADDLRRLLDHREIAARPTGALGRLRRAAKRRPAVAALTAALVLVLFLAAVPLMRARSGRQAAGEALHVLTIRSLEVALRLRRIGDTAGMREVMPQLLRAYANMTQADEHAAASPRVQYMMGRVYRALLDDKTSLAFQERALAADPDFAGALYERAVLRSRRYGVALARAMSERLDGDGPPGVEAAERAHPSLAREREQILADCTRLQTMSMGPAWAEAARGILEYHHRHLDEARTRLERALALDPSIEEAWEALGRTEAAAGHVDKAEAVFTRALELDRGYVPHLIGRCEVRTSFANAIADATAALAIDTRANGARMCRGQALVRQAYDLMMAGTDPLALLGRAEDDVNQVIRREQRPGAYSWRGTLRLYRGTFRARRGQDPTADFAASDADYGKALALEPRHEGHWNGRGRTRSSLAAYLMERGGDPSVAFAGAESDFTEATKSGSGATSAWMWRGDLRGRRGLHALRAGKPASGFFKNAEEDFARGPSHDDPWFRMLRGTMRIWRGRAVAESGGDPGPVWSSADEDLGIPIATFPGFVDPLIRRGLLHVEWGLHLRRTRSNRAAAELAAAAADLDSALSLEPANVEAMAARARLMP